MMYHVLVIYKVFSCVFLITNRKTLPLKSTEGEKQDGWSKAQLYAWCSRWHTTWWTGGWPQWKVPCLKSHTTARN